MSNSKIIKALSYLSITFAPLLVPLIIWILSQSASSVQYHARRAFFLHLWPVILTVGALIVIGVTGVTTNDVFSTSAVSLLLLGVIAVIDVVLYIYNLVYGIKVLFE